MFQISFAILYHFACFKFKCHLLSFFAQQKHWKASQSMLVYTKSIRIDNWLTSRADHFGSCTLVFHFYLRIFLFSASVSKNDCFFCLYEIMSVVVRLCLSVCCMKAFSLNLFWSATAVYWCKWLLLLSSSGIRLRLLPHDLSSIFGRDLLFDHFGFIQHTQDLIECLHQTLKNFDVFLSNWVDEGFVFNGVCFINLFDSVIQSLYEIFFCGV